MPIETERVFVGIEILVQDQIGFNDRCFPTGQLNLDGHEMADAFQDNQHN